MYRVKTLKLYTINSLEREINSIYLKYNILFPSVNAIER